ncbi:MAG: hypothetical protein ACD_58C00010G0007 [uncultured bacterium]|nr:MAG: hypothetical protein ACD_58C00010G0007 [uncultured bacterium]
MNKQINDLEKMRHSCEHVLTMAMMRLWSDKIKAAMGPSTDDGFYFDFDSDIKISADHFGRIEKEMAKIIKEDLPIIHDEMTAIKAKKFFSNNTYKGNEYKHEWIEEIEGRGEKVSVYWMGKKGEDIPKTFADICAGPHVESTKKIGPFKLLSLAGAYWHGDEKNKMLQRIYGTCFNTQDELDNYLLMLEEAKKRDHKKLGVSLDLFSFHQESPGSAFWHPNGMVIWNQLEALGKNIRKKNDYLEIQTPILAKQVLWITSGHWDHYKDSMFYFKNEKDTYCLKPMDCPFNIKIYQTKMRSYRDLPIRYTEIGRVLRNEKSGELNGLFRVRHITQDDSHVFLTEDQVEKEIGTLIKMAKEYYKIFNIKPIFYLSTMPEDHMGEVETWQKAEKDLENALLKQKVDYKIKEADGAFYGPKIDIDIEDALGRPWQLATIQLDFQLPGRFNLEYTDKDGSSKVPVMIHAAIFGSLERFIGIITEHYAGAFPTWLAPVQAVVLPISEHQNKFASEIQKSLLEVNVRVNINVENESLGKKIRQAQLEKIPYMLVVGEKEAKVNKVAVRARNGKDLGVMSVKKFVEIIKEEIDKKK